MPEKSLHSVSIGPLRFPQKIYERIYQLYPEDKLIAYPYVKRKSNYSYKEEIENEMQQFMRDSLANYAESSKFFKCNIL